MLKTLVCLCLLSAATLAQSADRPAAIAEKPEPIHIILDGAKKPGDCLMEGRAVQQEVQTLVFPPGWRIAVMCTRVRWETILQEADNRSTHEAFTRISERITVLNGAMFHGPQAHYRHVMAHELAHIRCNCADEGHAEELASKLEKGNAVEGTAGAAGK